MMKMMAQIGSSLPFAQAVNDASKPSQCFLPNDDSQSSFSSFLLPYHIFLERNRFRINEGKLT